MFKISPKTYPKQTHFLATLKQPTPTQSVASHDLTKVLPRPPFRSWACHVAAILCHDAPRPAKHNSTTAETNESMVSQTRNLTASSIILTSCVKYNKLNNQGPFTDHCSTTRWWVHHFQSRQRSWGSMVKACPVRPQGFRGPMKSYRDYYIRMRNDKGHNSKDAFA